MKKFLILALCLLAQFQVLAKADQALPTVESVDIGRFIGKWYAVSSLPQRFTRDCLGQTAEYSIRSENSINVLNTCLKKNNKSETIKGKAVVANPETNAELIVTFENFFTRLFRVKGDYNVILLDEGYENLLVGSKNRKSLWLMSRTPVMDEAVYKQYMDYAKSLGFDTSKLVISRF